MQVLWERPASVPVGQVWGRFKGRERNGKPALMYQIRDIDESLKEKALDKMILVYLRDEPISEALGVLQDPDSVATTRAGWEKFMSQNVSLACFTEKDGEPDELVAFNVIYVTSLADERFQDMDLDEFPGEALRKNLITIQTVDRMVDVFQRYNVDKYMKSVGLVVVPEHRGQNIGLRMLEAREPFCKALDVPATATIFTAINSQTLAAKGGFEVLAELEYKRMLEYDIDLTACKTPSVKIMGTKYKWAESNKKGN